MEITDGNLQTLAGYLEKTMAPEPDIRKPGTFLGGGGGGGICIHVMLYSCSFSFKSNSCFKTIFFYKIYY